MNNKFQKGGSGKGGCYTCNSCGKQTRETGDEESSIGMCRRCSRDSYWDNFHSDRCDGTVTREACPTCVENGYTEKYLNGR